MRAHRIGPPNNSGRPRTVIMKMLHYTDRDSILRASRKSRWMVKTFDLPRTIVLSLSTDAVPSWMQLTSRRKWVFRPF